MHERNEILVMLLVAGFFGSSFWPVLYGWVDLMTLEGWLTLLSGYGNLMIACVTLGLVISTGTIVIALPRFMFRALTKKSSDQRLAVTRALRILKSIGYQSLQHLWRMTWWLAGNVRRRTNIAG